MTPNWYSLLGTEQPETILFLHGAGATRGWFRPQAEALSRSYQIILPDLPGHGTLSNVTFSVDDTAERLAELLRTEANSPALVVGISLGGYLAMALAAKAPELTSGLILTGNSLNMNGWTGIKFKLTALFLRFMKTEKLEAGNRRGIQKNLSPERSAAVLDDGLYLEAMPRIFSEIAGRDYFKIMRDYTRPVLVLNGENDEGMRQQETVLTNLLSDGRLQVLPGAGHLTNLEQPEAYTLAVQQFAKEVVWKTTR
jgi:pimeloyl-ACP methyl ester carboxylesterase